MEPVENEIPARVGDIRIELECLLIIADRLAYALQLEQGAAAIDQRLDKIGPRLQHLVVIGAGFLEASELKKHVAPADERDGVPGFERQRARKGHQSIGIAPQLRERIAATAERSHV